MARKTRKRAGSPFASRRCGGGWRNLFAVLLCTLALTFNLLASVAYAESFRNTAAAGADGGLYICHSTPEAAASAAAGETSGKPAQAPVKCPLCQVSTAGLSAPPAAPLALPAPAAAASDIVPDAVATLHARPRTSRPETRGPPLFA